VAGTQLAERNLTMRKILIFAVATIATSTSAFAEGQYAPSTCAKGDYQNVDGICVHKPTAVPHEGATALCRDGFYSYATRGPDICAIHGGIAYLLRD
jgi:hypothetical protein